jgi:ferredoxin
VFFGGDSAFGPKNVITAVAHGHEAAISIHQHCQGDDVYDRPAPMTNLMSQKMGIHEWSYDSVVDEDKRYVVPQADKKLTLADRKKEVELGFDLKTAFKEAERCLNCDVQTVFNTSRCIECDACMDICPTACISFVDNGEEDDLRTRLQAPATNLTQDLYVSDILPSNRNRVMVKDEDVCLHCGLCAERCPTAAWDMQKYLYNTAKAEHACKV